MKSNYKRLGDYIQEVKLRNTEVKVGKLLGININKFFMPSVANVVGTDMSKYKIVKKRQFACNRMHVGRDKRLPVALWDEEEDIIVSPAYNVFEVIDEEVLFPEYLMMWFSRREFDRNAWFYTDADVRGGLNWNDFCDLELPVPSIEKQREIVKEYKVLQNRINLNNKLIEKLEDTAQILYKQWFIDFEFPDENGNSYKSNKGEFVYCEDLDIEIPKGWRVGTLNECIEFSNGYGFESDDLLDTKLENCYEVFKMGNIKRGGGLNINGTKSWIEKEKCNTLKRFILKKEDLLMAMTDMKDNMGILGNTAIMNVNDNYILNQRVGLLRTNNSFGISFRHLYVLTNSKSFLQDIRSRANRGVQVNLTTTEIVSSKLTIAPKYINDAFDNILEKLFARISGIQKDIECSEKMLELLLCNLTIMEG